MPLTEPRGLKVFNSIIVLRYIIVCVQTVDDVKSTTPTSSIPPELLAEAE